MTAINVLVGYGETHLFADTGHYNPATKRLNHLAQKVYPLPEQDALLAWSGVSSVGSLLATEIRQSGISSILELIRSLPDIVRRLPILGRFSAIAVGAGCGISVEQGDKIHYLTPGTFIRSLPASTVLDPSNLNTLRASAVELMKEQRQTSGVVFGECQYWHIGGRRATMQILHDWRDTPEKILVPSTLAAKIGDLQVDRINFAANAVTGIVEGDDEVTSLGDGTFPNIVNANINCTYHGTGSGAYGNLECRVTYQGSTGVIATGIRNFSGSGFTTITLRIYSVDFNLGANQAYKISAIGNGSTGGGGSNASVTVNSITSSVIYSLR